MKKKIYPLLALCMLFFVLGISQTPQRKSAKPFFGQAGIRKKISDLRAPSTTANLRKKTLDSTAIKPLKSYFKRYENSPRYAKGNRVGMTLPHGEGEAKRAASATSSATSSAAAISTSGSTQQIWSNFLSIDFYENPIGWPPDPTGDVGPSQVIVSTL